MLRPVTNGLQPFRFVSLAADDHRRLGALVGQGKTKEANPRWIGLRNCALRRRSTASSGVGGSRSQERLAYS